MGTYKSFLVVLLLISLCFLNSCFNDTEEKGKVNITNNADFNVISGTIKVCNQVLEIGSLNKNESKELYFFIGAESHYEVKVVFNTNKILNKELGYIGPMMTVDDLLIVTNDEINLKIHRKGRWSEVNNRKSD
ncbi:MAG: hypothetical protein ABII88_08900 [Candidatus Omnitrophota bacterium]